MEPSEWATGLPRVAIFCPTFLQPEMLHVYRQVAGLKKVAPVVLTFKRKNADLFPFEPVRFVHRSSLRWLRRIWSVQIRKIPQQAYPKEVRSMELLLTKDRCQLMHIYFGNNGLFWLPFLRKRKIPAVVSFHGADVQVNVDSRVAKRLFRDLFASCALVLARSESLASALVALGCPPEKLRIQRAGIPLETFRYFARQRPADGAWRLLQACRLVEKKGLELTLRAFAAFLQRHSKAHLTIAGDGPLRGALEKLATDLRLDGRIEFTGFVDQPTLLRLYQNSHIFLHPSELTPDGNREGVPNSLLEAMATGLPCVATRHGGIPEAITDLESGVLVPESDLAGIEKWLDRLAADDRLRESIGKRAAQTIQEKFDLTTQIEKLEKIYQEFTQEFRSSGVAGVTE
jgi:colanic acid/amylovoran biosynthesis glycosyltransferase